MFYEVIKSCKNNYYIALVEIEDYRKVESRNVLKRLYQNSARNFLAALYDGESLSGEDLRELEDYIIEKRMEHGK